MSYYSFKKQLKERRKAQEAQRESELRAREENEVITELNSTILKLEAKREDYTAKAKEELKAGNNGQYLEYVNLIRITTFNLAQTKDLLANYTVARDMREMRSLNQKVVKSLDSVMREVYKQGQKLKLDATQKIFTKAVFKNEYANEALQKFLQQNNIAFSCSVNSLSDISEAEIRSTLEREIKNDEKMLNDTLSQLEDEFSVKTETVQPTTEKASVAQNASANVIQESIQDRAQTATPTQSEGVTQNATEANTFVRAEEDKKEVPVLNGNFKVSGAAYRPQKLSDYMGQPNAVAILEPPIKEARLTGKTLSHVLLCGAFGQGKTTLAKIIANEMHGNFIELSASVSSKDLQRTLKSLKPGDIVFIDEIHGVDTKTVENVLYKAMEDFKLVYTERNGAKSVNIDQNIAPFTLIGATTETGKLLRPFYSKFPIKITLSEYSVETIAAIVKNSFRMRSIKISDEQAVDIAKRSRLVPRIANAFVDGISSRVIVKAAESKNLVSEGVLKDKNRLASLNAEVTDEDIVEFFKQKKIDKLGLEENELKILEILTTRYKDKAIGVDMLSNALNLVPNRVSKEYEPYLVKLGFIEVGTQGRRATDAAYAYLGKKRDTETQDEAFADDAKEVRVTETTDDLPTIECEIGAADESAFPRFDALFAGDGRANESTLDELFPDVDKEYDSDAKNRCILKISNGREIYCDSKLERRFLTYLFQKGYAIDAKSEALELEYTTQAAVDRKYYPDFVLKLHDNSVAVVEMKNLSSMGYHLNVDKYEKLAEWCQENGYRYAEIAKDCEANRYVSAETLKAQPINEELRKFILDKIASDDMCAADALESFGYDVKELVGLLLNDRTLKNIDRTGNSPKIVAAN